MGQGLFLAGTVGAAVATTQDPFAGISRGALATIEMALKETARNEVRTLARYYAGMDGATLPGVRRFGLQMDEVLALPVSRLNFEGIISRNPVFWQAERELHPIDPSLPYLVVMVAVLSDDYITAARLLALNQATLPMTPMIRRIYCRPEAMMITREVLLLQGLPKSTEQLTVQQYERMIGVAGVRIAHWPNQLGLARTLLEMEVKRTELAARGTDGPAVLQVPIGVRLKLTDADRAFARKSDPIWSTALTANAADWLAKRTLAQRWIRWIEYSDPAESAEIAESVAVYEAEGRFDLAWLTWRAGRALELFVDEPGRWQNWAKQLLGDAHTAELAAVIKANPSAGRVSLPIPAEGFGEAWSGDQNIHPLLAIKIERQLALIDTWLLTAEPGSLYMANLYARRMNHLCDIYAVEGARKEMEKIRAILGESAMPPARERLARLEGDFATSVAIYRELLKNPKNESARKNYATTLYMSGEYRAAWAEYRKVAKTRPDDGYLPIMADLAARRVGKRETAMLEAARTKLPADTWLGAGLRFVLGELTAEHLLAAAQTGTKYEATQRECEGYFWIAQTVLAEGDVAQGVYWLKRCLATGLTSFIEYQAAKAELERLEPEGKNKRKPGEGGASRGVQPA